MTNSPKYRTLVKDAKHNNLMKIAGPLYWQAILGFTGNLPPS
jgi:hypothetical protein